MKRAAHSRAGFTLVELLIGMALLALILTATVQIFMSSSRASSRLNAMGDAQQEAINGLQFISARTKEAWYVYPAGSVLNFSLPAGAQLAANPATGTRAGTTSYAVGQEPALAMILPPQDASAACNVTTSPLGCYRFFGYIAVDRGVWASRAASFNQPGPSTGSSPTWVLAEYRALYAAPPAIVEGGSLPVVATGVPQLNLLMTDLAPAIGGTAPNYQLFTLQSVTLTAPRAYQLATWPLAQVEQIRQDLRVLRQQGGQSQSLPSATTTFQLNVVPENVGRSP